MELQEAINHAREVSDKCSADNRDCAYQHDKLADWLEELKSLRTILGDEYDLDVLKLLLDNDKSCYTCKHYKGEKTCGFKDLDVEINPQEGCSVREAALRREQDG